MGSYEPLNKGNSRTTHKNSRTMLDAIGHVILVNRNRFVEEDGCLCGRKEIKNEWQKLLVFLSYLSCIEHELWGKCVKKLWGKTEADGGTNQRNGETAQLKKILRFERVLLTMVFFGWVGKDWNYLGLRVLLTRLPQQF